MSVQFSCPHCGTRPIEEFLYGEVPVVPDDITDADERDLHRSFMIDNTEGVARERWFHTYGCRRWLWVTRDRSTDTVIE